jgi:hypothetical protein
MEKVEKNRAELEKYKASLKNKKTKKNGDEEMYGKVIFSYQGKSLEDQARIQFLTGHHAGKVLVIDENDTFKDVFVKFISNSQDYLVLENGNFKISDTSGNSRLGNYEVILEEVL